jgi:hypothetical protein
VALRMEVKPSRYAFGAAAALAILDPSALDESRRVASWLDHIWAAAKPDTAERMAVLGLIEEGRQRLRRWIDSGYASL